MSKFKKIFVGMVILSQLLPLAFAAGVPEKHPTDSFQIGVGSSSATKNFLFDLGLGASNPKLGVDSSSILNYTKNNFSLGDGTNTQKKFVANIGNGATNPALSWNNTLNQWQFSNDGTNYQGIGSGGGGSKNYLSNITASAGGGTPNTGNGNFEFGTTGGWSLAHTNLSSLFPSSTASPGSAFSASSGGSSASANLSLTAISSGQIQGLYSGNLTSSTASVAGDMMISSAFYIDKEDEGKVMTFKFYYNVNAGVSNLNLSGTSSNTYVIYVYDVTNGAWIQPAGVYNIIQGSGTGYSTGTFQTTTNSTQYQFALVNINASGGSFTFYLDDFFVGPQTAPLGPSMSDWQSFTMSITGTTSDPTRGSVDHEAAYWRRVGDSAQIRYEFIQSSGGSSGSGTYLFHLPPGLSLDTSKIVTNGNTGSNANGSGIVSDGTNWHSVSASVDVSTTTAITLALDETASVQLIGSSHIPLGAAARYGFFFTVPIAGWSSNSVQSSDTDTRVVSFSAYNNAGSVTANTTISSGWTTNRDTAGAFSSGTYTVPVTGDYFVSFIVATTGGTPTAEILKNGSLYGTGMTSGSSQTRSTVSSLMTGLKAGDTISVSLDSSLTITSSTTDSILSINRLSGPAVVTADSSVYASYRDSTTTVGTATIIDFSHKVYDNMSAVTTGASWNFATPISGSYQVCAFAVTPSISWTVGQEFVIVPYVNGSPFDAGNQSLIGAISPVSATIRLSGSGCEIITLNAGDKLDFRGTLPTPTAWAPEIRINIKRIGNI